MRTIEKIVNSPRFIPKCKILHLQLKCNLLNFMDRCRKDVRNLTKIARNTDTLGSNGLLELIDAKLAVIENSYKMYDRDRSFECRDIKLVRSLIKKYLSGNFFEYEGYEIKNGFLNRKNYRCNVYVNLKTVGRILQETFPSEQVTERVKRYYCNHPDEIYRIKLNNLIWNILRDRWTSFCL